jgi:hypothetical protein
VCIDERPLDGKRFLMVQLPDREPQIERRQIDLVLNWVEELKRDVPSIQADWLRVNNRRPPWPPVQSATSD